MSKNWLEAAQRYARKKKDFDMSAEQFPALAAIIEEMLRFHRSPEGAVAMLMLELADSAISFGEGVDNYGQKVLFCWTYRGPSRIIVGGSLARSFGEPLPAPFYDCAKALVRNGMTDEEFPRWFKTKLDEIAAQAPAASEA